MADITQSPYYQEGLNNVKGRSHPIPEDEQKAYARAYANARENGADKKAAQTAGNKGMNDYKSLRGKAQKAAKDAQEKAEKKRKEEEERREEAKRQAANQQNTLTSTNVQASMAPSGMGQSVDNAQKEDICAPLVSQSDRKKYFASIFYSITTKEELTCERQYEIIKSKSDIIFELLKEPEIWGNVIASILNPGVAIGSAVGDCIYEWWNGKPKEDPVEKRLRDRLAKMVFNLTFPAIHEEYGQPLLDGMPGDDPKGPPKDVNIIANVFKDCSRLRLSDKNAKLVFSKEARNMLVSGIKSVINAMKAKSPGEMIIDIGGHCELNGFIYVACSLFHDSGSLTFKLSNGKTKEVNFKKATSSGIWNDKDVAELRKEVESLKCKGWVFTLNYAVVAECNRLHFTPPIAEGPKGLKAFVDNLSNIEEKDVADAMEFVPCIGGIIQAKRLKDKEDPTVWDYVSTGISIINPPMASFGATLKRKADPNYEFANLIHIQLAVASFIPHPIAYLGAPLLDIALHCYEMSACYDKRDRKGCVSHAKAMIIDLVCLIPAYKAAKLWNQGKKMKHIYQIERTMLNEARFAKTNKALAAGKTAQAEKIEAEINQLDKLKAERQAHLENYKKNHNGETPEETLKRADDLTAKNEKVKQQLINDISKGGSEKTDGLKKQLTENANTSSELHNEYINDPDSDKIRQLDKEIADIEAKRGQPEALRAEADASMGTSQTHEAKSAALESQLKSETKGMTIEQQQAYAKYFINESYLQFQKTGTGPFKFEDNSFSFMSITEKQYQRAVLESANQPGVFKKVTGVLTGEMGEGILTTNGIVQDSYGLLIHKEDKTNPDSELVVKDINWNWADVWAEATLGAVLDVLYLPSDIVSFMVSEDSNKPFTNMEDIRNYMLEEYGIAYVENKE